jgi:hypothetical protein
MRISKVVLIVAMVLFGDFLISAEIGMALAHNHNAAVLTLK